MKLILQHRHHQPSPAFTALLKQQLDLRQLRIDEARVLVERRLEASPAFRVAAHLVTPGPDVLAEDVDHTPGAALRKTIAQLEARIVCCQELREFESQRNRTAMQRNEDDSCNGSAGVRPRAAPPQDAHLSLRLEPATLSNSPHAVAGISKRTQRLVLAALRLWEHRNRDPSIG
jgi:hypothetical protein